MCHIRLHNSCRADFHLVKITFAELRLIRAKNLIQLFRRVSIDVLRSFFLHICFYINIPQNFIPLCQCKLNACLHGIDINRRSRLSGDLSCNTKLIAEHKLYQFDKHAVFCVKDILKRADRNMRLSHNFRNGCSSITLF